GFPEATWLLLPSPVMAAMRGPTSRRRDAGSRSGGALGVPVRGLGASVLLFEQRERERRAVRARLDVERRLQGEVGRGGPLAARGARLPESSARCSSSSDCRPTLFGASGFVLPSRLVGTSSPGATSPPPSVTRLGDQPRWSGVIGSCPSAPTKSLACPVTYQ